MNTTGLLLITNDGELAHAILQPKNKMEKEYIVTIKEKLKDNIQKLETGITIMVNNKPYKTLPAKVNRTEESTFSITITEGKKRQVRLMVAALGYTLLSLKRIRIGALELKTLEEGNIKELNEKEIKGAFSVP